MERFDYAEELKTILQPFHEAPSSAARAQVLRELAIKIKYLSTIQEKEYVICCLLRNTPPLVPGTLEETAMLQCLQAGEPSVLITATLRILQEIPQSLTALELSLTLLKQIMSTRPTTDAQEWLSLLTPESVERWVNLLIRVPNLVANACQAFQVPFPAWTVQARYFPKMVDHAVCWCLLAEKRPTIQSRQMYLLSLIKHMLRRGGEEITKGLYQAYERGDSLPALYNIVANILSDLSPREFAILSRSMMRHILSVCPVPLGKDRYAHPWLDETLRKVVLRSTLHADALVELLLFSADPHHDVAYITASMLANITESHDDDSSSVDSDESSPEDTLLRRHLIAVVDRWSRPNYVLETPNRQQSHVTAFLRFGMKLLCEPKEDAASELVASVLEGITCRLSSTDPDIRRDGMQIAVLLANRLGEKLEFDELQDSHNGEVEATNIPEERKPVNVAEKIAQKSRRRFRNADPDAPYISEDDDSTEKSGDSWDDEEEDAPFDLEDDEEDLADTAKPRFLSDCLDLLRTPETEDYASSRHETALAELSQLVRSRPMDLPDIAATIAFELVHMENKFDIKGFADMVSSSLRSLAVEEPLLVGETLIQEVFQDIGLSDRICALRALSEAAYEMARLFGLEQHNLSTKQISDRGAATTQRDVVDPSLRKVGLREVGTRRWGHSNRKPSLIRNSFTQVAPIWFYSLVRTFMERKEDDRLWKGSIGATFLSTIFQTLAAFVECSRYGPSVLAKDLIQLVWGFHQADVGEVRTAVLLAVTVSFTHLGTEDALALLLDADIPQDLSLMATKDPDEKCRELAVGLMSNITQTMDSLSIRPVTEKNKL